MADLVQNIGTGTTQRQRDDLSQADHDKLVEYGVMLRTIMDGQARLEQQIKDLINGQATALATWEAKSNAVHDDHDRRIRKMEDLAVQYVPLAQTLEERTTRNEKDIQKLQNDKNEVIAGWRVIVWVLGGMAGFVSFLILIVGFLFRWHLI